MKTMINPFYSLLLMTAIVILAGCGQATHEEHSNDDHQANATGSATVSAIPLNNGSKWQLDDATRQNMLLIRHAIMDTTFADNTAYATALKDRTGQLVKQCRMSGPDHDALHVWLTGFLEHQKQLSDPQEAENARTRLKEDIQRFESAFE